MEHVAVCLCVWCQILGCAADTGALLLILGLCVTDLVEIRLKVGMDLVVIKIYGLIMCMLVKKETSGKEIIKSLNIS